MTNKKILRTGVISTIALLASNNAAFAASCDSAGIPGDTGYLAGYCLTDGNAKFSIVTDTTSDQYGMDMSVDGNTQVWVLDL